MGNSGSQRVVVAAKVGQRVVRGPDWKWGNQDDGEGHVGTVELVGGDVGSRHPKKTVVVQWDSGKRANYRSGANDAYDLRLFDNAATGVIHRHVICDGCQENGIIGVRWQCLPCTNYDLCSICYMNGKHDLAHPFKRIDAPSMPGVDVPRRQGLPRVQAKGVFVGGKVVRGPDWMWGNQDGGEGCVGELVKMSGLNDTPGRSIANVRWSRTGKTNVYRFGHNGKMDLKFVEAVSGGFYYRDHLPLIGEVASHSNIADDPFIIKVGDKVKVALDVEILQTMQEGHGGWNATMAQYIGKVGTVHSITSQSDIIVQYEGCNNRWTFHPAAVTKVTGSSITAGCIVQVSDNLELVKQLQSGHGEWIDPMLGALGKVGKVLKIDSDGDVRVKVDGHAWTFHPQCVSLVPGAAVEPVTDSDTEDDSASGLAQLLVLQHLLEKLKTGSSDENLVSEAAKGNVETVRKILKEHPETVNDKNSEKTALQVATYQGHKEVVEILLEANANLEIRDGDGDTALHYAAFGNEPEIMEILLKKGASVNAVNKNGSTTLHVAVSKQHDKCVQILLNYNCNLNMQDSVGDTVFHDAITTENLEILDFLLGVDNLNFNISNKRGFNLLHHAALKGNNFAMERILEKAPTLVDSKKDDGFTSLHLAALNNHRLVTETLITKGRCNVNLKNNSDQTPLILAARQGHCGVVELLVDRGADINIGDDEGDTPLHMVLIKSFYSQTTTTETTDTDAPTIQEILANLRGLKLADVYLAIACFLTQRGADLSLKNNKGKSPADLIPVPKVKDVINFYASMKTNEAASTPKTVPVQRSVSTESGLCAICEGLATVSFEPCGHKVACEECCIRMKKCITCQAVILKKIGPGNQLICNPIYHASNDKLSQPVVEESQRCLICMDKRRNVAFLCGHGACGECAQNLQTCHMCRKPITQKINLY